MQRQDSQIHMLAISVTPTYLKLLLVDVDWGGDQAAAFFCGHSMLATKMTSCRAAFVSKPFSACKGPFIAQVEKRTQVASRTQGVPSARGLGWVDLNFECFTSWPILPGLMGIWQKRLGSRARWWNTQIKVNPTQVHEQMGHPVLAHLIVVHRGLAEGLREDERKCWYNQDGSIASHFHNRKFPRGDCRAFRFLLDGKEGFLAAVCKTILDWVATWIADHCLNRTISLNLY